MYVCNRVLRIFLVRGLVALIPLCLQCVLGPVKFCSNSSTVETSTGGEEWGGITAMCFRVSLKLTGLM